MGDQDGVDAPVVKEKRGGVQATDGAREIAAAATSTSETKETAEVQDVTAVGVTLESKEAVEPLDTT